MFTRFHFRFAASVTLVLLGMLFGIGTRAGSAESALGSNGMVASVHPIATDIGTATLRSGGNAVDAAVATALALGVVDGHNSGIGGGCFILIRKPDGKLIAIDGRETAPALATRDMYIQNGELQATQSRTGPLAAATPGALAAYQLAIEQHGKKKLADLLAPAAKVAEEGFAIDRVYARNVKDTANDLAKFPASKQMVLNEKGEPPTEGTTLRLPDLGATYRAVAAEGIDWFYRGPFAEKTSNWMSANGGILARGDFADYRPKIREPIVTSYRGFTIVGFPPPSSGGVHVAQILNVLEAFDLREMYSRDQSEFVHVVAEAMKLAFADRAYWLGDGDFVPVPRGLLDKDYAKKLVAKIDLKRAAKVDTHGRPLDATTNIFPQLDKKHTTHIAAADAEGNWVGITATVNTSFGSKVVIPETGVVLNNQMDDFSIQPGVANAFGLVGAEANAIAPGKRPLSSMSPTVVLKDGRPIMTVGAAGGPTIITQVVLAIVRHIDLGMPVDDALGAPRFHHQWSPTTLSIERSIGEDVRSKLERRGHTLKLVERLGVSQSIARPDPNGPFIGVHDPRVPGKASGVNE